MKQSDSALPGEKVVYQYAKRGHHLTERKKNASKISKLGLQNSLFLFHLTSFPRTLPVRKGKQKFYAKNTISHFTLRARPSYFTFLARCSLPLPSSYLGEPVHFILILLLSSFPLVFVPVPLQSGDDGSFSFRPRKHFNVIFGCFSFILLFD